MPKILKAKYRGLKKVIEAFPSLFRIGTDHIINPTIFLNENRRPGPIEPDPNSPGGRLTDLSNPPQQTNRSSSGQNLQRSNQDKSKWNSRHNENSYRSGGRGSGGYGGGYNNRNMDRMMHTENEEYDDPRYYYDQYGGYGHPRGGQGYSNYSQGRDSRNQYGDTRGAQYPDYDYDPRWNQQDMPRSRNSHRDAYGSDPNLYDRGSYGADPMYQSDRGSRDPYGADPNMYPPERGSRYNQNPPQTWAAYQEYENPTQRNNSNYYPRSDQRGTRQNDEYGANEYDDYRRTSEYDQFSGPSQEGKQSSGWLDIEGLIGAGTDATDHYGNLDSGLDLNFQL